MSPYASRTRAAEAAVDQALIIRLQSQVRQLNSEIDHLRNGINRENPEVQEAVGTLVKQVQNELERIAELITDEGG